MPNFTMYDREREFKWQIECQLSGGTYAYIDAEDIYSGRLTRQISSGEGIEVGSCYVSELDLTIVASALPSNVVSVKPYFRLLTSTEIVEGVVRKYYTPYNLGVFKIASTKRKEYGRIDLVCYDKMADLDKLITPANYTELLASDWKPFYLLDWIATKVGVTYTFTQAGIEAMPNGTLYFKLAEETSNIKTYRDLLQYVCMLIGAYAIFDEDGHLNVKTFADTTSYSLPASFRFSESFGDVPIAYSGVELTVKNATTMFGNANNTVVTLSDNPFLYKLSTLNSTTDYATFIMQFLRNIYIEFQGLSYYAGEFEIPPDASLNVGRLLAVTGGGASNTINCFLQKIDVNFDGRMMLSCGNPNTYVARTQNRTTSSITNLTNRIETLESSQGGGNKIYTSKSAPDNTLGNDGDLWIKYFVDYNDILVNSHGDEVKINLPRYESADDAYNYVDLTIRPQIRSMCNLATTAINAFVKAFQGQISIAVYQLASDTYNITASQFPQLTVDTYTINNQSFNVSDGADTIGWSDNPIHYKYIGVSDYRYRPVANLEDFNDNLSDGREIKLRYYYLYYNTSNKKFEYINGLMDLNNVNHTYYKESLSKNTSDVTIDLINTSFTTIDKIYCKIGDDWVSYDGDDGSEVVVNQILQSGTEIAQISVNGEVVSIYAPQNEIYYGTSLPTTDIGQDSSLYYKIIQRPEDLKTLNVVEYIQSARASYIPTDILMTNNTRIMMRGIFYQGDYNGGAVAFGINGNDSDGGVSRFVAGTSAFRDTSNCFFSFGNDNVGYRRSCEGIYGTDVMLMADTATRTLTISGGGASHSVTVPSSVLYTPSSVPIGILCANMSSEAGGFEIRADWSDMNANAIIKRFQVYENNVLSYDLIPVQNANDVTDCGLYDRIHRKYYPGANYYNNTPFTAGTPTGEVINQLDECVEAGYLRVNDEWWEIYNGGTEYFAGNYIEITENNVITSTLKAGTNIQIADDGTISASATEIVQIVTSGTELATINGTSIYAPTVSASQTQTSGTEIGNITVGSTSTTLYAPTPQSVSVTQTLASGTEIGSVTIDNTTTTLYAPSGGGGGSTVTVTPITTSGTNIANIAVDGTTYNLFAPSGGGGEAIETALIYSNEERVVGVWTDNKPLYQKTLNLTSPSEAFGGYIIADLTNLNIENLVKVEGFLYSATYSQTLPIYWSYTVNSSDIRSSNFGTVYYENGCLKQNINQTAYSQCPVTITIQYTKTTDTPGSAPYVTSGAYAHHYSTTEQVVGTWIDGSTIYEKTQYGGITFSSQGTWYDTDITNIDKIVSVEGSINKDGEPINIGYWNSSIVSCWVLINHTLKMSMQAMTSGEVYTLNSITVRYTKTS